MEVAAQVLPPRTKSKCTARPAKRSATSTTTAPGRKAARGVGTRSFAKTLWRSRSPHNSQRLSLGLTRYAAFRAALQVSFQQEQEFRRNSLEALRRRQDEIEKKKDVLTERYLEDRIADEEYQRKYADYQREPYDLKENIARLESAHELYVEELELLCKLGGQLANIFMKTPDSGTKRAIAKLVASNAVLKGGNARLNLFPTFEALSNRGDHPKWWAL